MFGTVRKWRYISPAGHVNYSLRLACLNLQSHATNPQTVRREPTPQNAGLIAAPVVQLSVMKKKKKKTQLRLRRCFVRELLLKRRTAGRQPQGWSHERCHGEESLISRARKHLSAVGWTFHYVIKHWSNKSKRELRYVPPNVGRKKFSSLRKASIHHPILHFPTGAKSRLRESPSSLCFLLLGSQLLGMNQNKFMVSVRDPFYCLVVKALILPRKQNLSRKMIRWWFILQLPRLILLVAYFLG